MEEQFNTILKRGAVLLIGTAIGVIGVFFMVLGFTFLPVIGIFAGIASMNLAAYFLGLQGAESRKEKDETALRVLVGMQSWCPWPSAPEERKAA